MANFSSHPKKDPAKLRKLVPLSMNSSERQAVDECARLAGMNRSDYIWSLVSKSKEYKQVLKARKATQSDDIPGQMSIDDIYTES